MAVVTFEGIVEAGQIRLLSGERLPERATVYVVVPDYAEDAKQAYTVTLPKKPCVMSPHVLTKEDTQRFHMDMIQDTNAGI